jgi:hypothetical protein
MIARNEAVHRTLISKEANTIVISIPTRLPQAGIVCRERNLNVQSDLSHRLAGKYKARSR